MRVLLISSGSGSRGGGEIYLHLLARGLKELGHTVITLIPAHARMDELAEQMGHVAEVRRFPFVATYERKSRPLGAAFDRRQQHQSAQIMAEIGADIIHVNQQVSEDGLDLLIAANRTGMPWVSTIHVGWGASDLGAQFGVIRDVASKRVLRSLNGLHIAVSEASKKQLQDRLKMGSNNIHAVLNGVLPHAPSALALASVKAREDWGVSSQDLVVGAVGRIEPQKDPIAFVERFAEIATANQRLHLVWIGDGGMREELERSAAKYSDRMTLIVDGWRDDAGQRLAGFDIFALPSKFEGLPLALLEAMHAGLPIIANRTDGVGEAITHGETGFLCQSPSDWHDAALPLVTQPDVRETIGNAAQQVAKAHFSIASMAKSTEDLYQVKLAQTQNGIKKP